MQKFKDLLLFTFAAFIAISLAASTPAAWSLIPNYASGVNVIDVNWNYSTYIGPEPPFTYQTFNTQPVGYVLVNLNNIADTNLNDIRAVGYGPQGQTYGLVSGYMVAQNGNNIVILLSNRTVSNSTGGSIPWSFATVWYNPINPTNPLNSSQQSSILNTFWVQCENIAACGYSYKNTTFLVPDPLILKSLNPVVPIGQQVFINETLGIPPKTSNSLNAFISAKLNTSAIIILANRSLSSTPFNITFNPDGSHTLKLNNSNKFSLFGSSTEYNLYTLGGIFNKPFVSGISRDSANANDIYNGVFQFDNQGFEAYLSVTSYNSFIGENVVANKADIYNGFPLTSSDSIGRYLNLFAAGGAGYLNISSNTMNSITWYVLPAFTTSYVTQNAFANPNAANFINLNCTLTSTGIQNLCTFRQHALISNINWNYNLTSFAYPTNTNMPYDYIYNSVGYLKMSMPKYVPFFGQYCQNIYATLNSSYGFDPVAFYASCNSTSMTLLISNKSKNGYIGWNSLIIYAQPYQNIPSQSNTLLYNNWLVASGNSFSLPLPGSYKWQLTLNHPLNPSSAIGYGGPNGVGFTVNANSKYELATYYSDVIHASLVTDPNFATTFILSGTSGYGSTPATQLIQEPYIYAQIGSPISFAWDIFNTTINTNIEISTPTTFDVYTYNGINATIVQLYTSKAILHNWNSTLNNTFSGQNTTGASVAAPNLPHSTTGLNFSLPTKPLTFNALSNLIVLAPGVAIPQFALLILAIILIIIASTMFATHNAGQFPFVLMLIAIWSLALWQIQLLYLAIPVTLAFAVIEFTAYKKNHQAGAVHGS